MERRQAHGTNPGQAWPGHGRVSGAVRGRRDPAESGLCGQAESGLCGQAAAALAADAVGVAIAAFLAWSVTRGSAAARALIIVWTIGLIQKVLWGAGMKSGGLLAIGVLALYLAQIALLVSTPIYQRVSGGWAGRRPGPARLWPTPPGGWQVLRWPGACLSRCCSWPAWTGSPCPAGRRCRPRPRGA
jgi:hypothetical protein